MFGPSNGHTRDCGMRVSPDPSFLVRRIELEEVSAIEGGEIKGFTGPYEAYRKTLLVMVILSFTVMFSPSAFALESVVVVLERSF